MWFCLKRGSLPETPGRRETRLKPSEPPCACDLGGISTLHCHLHWLSKATTPTPLLRKAVGRGIGMTGTLETLETGGVLVGGRGADTAETRA